jgi:hypothetical protein
MAVAATSWVSVGWLGYVTMGWGRARGLAEMAHARWGFAVVVVVEGKGEGREFWQGGLGLLLFPSITTRYDKGSISIKISCWSY